MIDANTARIALVGAFCFGLLIGSFIGAALQRWSSRQAKKRGLEMTADDGQASILVVTVLALFLLLFLGFAVDETNLFLHRQMVQSAADSACVAGISDMYRNQISGTTLGGFTAGQDFDCATLSTAAPCKYAALNGYASTGLSGPGTNIVKVTFPSEVPGVVTPPVAVAGNYPFIMTNVTDRVQTFFVNLATRRNYQDVRAIAKCGLVVAQSPVPILVLDTTEQDTFHTVGNPKVRIVGGPTRSIQVNSGDAAAVRTPFGNATVDLTLGGPKYDGSDFGVTGGPVTAPNGFVTTPPAMWQGGVNPVQDPFVNTPPPVDPGIPGQTFTTSGDGCPVAQCTEYTAGDYPTGIYVQNHVALFQPGVYYVSQRFEAHANSLLRPSTAVGDASYGTIFYLKAGASVLIGADSGKVLATAWDTSLAHCPGDNPFPAQLKIPPTVDGNVLVAPCTKDGTYPQAPGKGVGPDRGILFWQDRSAQASETMNGGGGLLLVGTLYFHECANSLTTGCLAPPNEYQTTFTLVGNSGSNTKVLGEIVTDWLTLKGSATLTMDLNPFSIPQLKMALVQ